MALRYGDEFAALIEERGLAPRDFLDVMFGALDARLRPQVAASVEAGTNRRLSVNRYARSLKAQCERANSPRCIIVALILSVGIVSLLNARLIPTVIALNAWMLFQLTAPPRRARAVGLAVMVGLVAVTTYAVRHYA